MTSASVLQIRNAILRLASVCVGSRRDLNAELPKVGVGRNRPSNAEIIDNNLARAVREAPTRSGTLLEGQGFPYRTLSWSAPLNGSVMPSIGTAAMRSMICNTRCRSASKNTSLAVSGAARTTTSTSVPSGTEAGDSKSEAAARQQGSRGVRSLQQIICEGNLVVRPDNRKVRPCDRSTSRTRRTTRPPSTAGED